MRSRDPERSQQEILAAAEAEFAEKGFFGARVDEIALAAGINKRMLYAYFGDKETYARQLANLSTYAVIDVNGEWHEKGHMGWFGCGSETGEEARAWHNSWYERFFTRDRRHLSLEDPV